MVLFALLVIVASLPMVKSRKNISGVQDKEVRTNRTRLLFYGLATGITTGLLGAGGGFLVIPALVIFLGFPMKEAIGTSLLIIALNTMTGFLGDLGNMKIDWGLLAKVSALSIAGIYAGDLIGKKLNGDQLRKAFGWFIFAMGVFILVKEILAGN